MIRLQKADYHGIVLPDYGIGLDISRPGMAQYTFISHAHADHMPRDRAMSVYATPPTADFMRERGFRGDVHTLEFNEPLEMDHFRVTFFPAGHILGSAMTFIETGEGNLLYTGDYKTPPSPASEGFELPDKPVHQFITEATFSLPIYRWRMHEELFEEIRNFALEALDGGYTPIFLAYNLGKAQEVMHALAPLGHRVQIHGAGYKLCSTYEKFGIDLGHYEAYDRDRAEGAILVTPTSVLSTVFASNIPKKRIAYCSGWASLESRRTQLTVDKLIPLSDHLDFFALLDLCEQMQPELVYLTHTPNPDVLHHYLGEMGITSKSMDLEVPADE